MARYRAVRVRANSHAFRFRTMDAQDMDIEIGSLVDISNVTIKETGQKFSEANVNGDIDLHVLLSRDGNSSNVFIPSKIIKFFDLKVGDLLDVEPLTQVTKEVKTE